jgi:hypothetical protein
MKLQVRELDGRTDGRTDRQTDTAGRSNYICDTARDLTLQKKSGQASK